MAWVDRFVRYASDTTIKLECEKRFLHIPRIPIEPPKIYGVISATDLISYLPKTYVGLDGKTYTVRIDVGWNTKYNLTSLDEVKRFLRWNLINIMKYTDDDFDCEAFAIATWGNYKLWGKNTVLGMDIAGGHAINWGMDYQKKLFRIEPQSDVVNLGLPADSSHFFG